MITTELNIYLCDFSDFDNIFETLSAHINEPLPAATHLEIAGEPFIIEADKTELVKKGSTWVTTLYAYRLCADTEVSALSNKLASEGFKIE